MMEKVPVDIRAISSRTTDRIQRVSLDEFLVAAVCSAPRGSILGSTLGVQLSMWRTGDLFMVMFPSLLVLRRGVFLFSIQHLFSWIRLSSPVGFGSPALCEP